MGNQKGGRERVMTVFIRSMALFLFAVLSIRVMGKRQVGQLQPFELVVAIMIADLAATPMESVATPLLYGIVPMAALVILQGALSLASMKSLRVRALLSGRPAVLVRGGQVQMKELEKLCFTLNDLIEELRAGGCLDPAEVETAVLETSGKVSVFQKPGSRPLTPDDLRLHPAAGGLPLTLVMDGRAQPHSLSLSGQNENWLRQKLTELGFADIRRVALATLSAKGTLTAQGYAPGELRQSQAINPSEVTWTACGRH